MTDFPTISGDTANLILLDVGQGVPPEQSDRLSYGPEELRFRASVEADWQAYKKEHPDAMLDVRE